MTTPFAADGLDELGGLLETMRQLRDPKGGCPWDLEQTHASLQHAMLEESYEAMEALASGDTQATVEELGDLLIQVVFHAQIGSDDGAFSLTDVARCAREKLVRRHPHVFGGDQLSTPEEVKRRWDQLKALEREAKGKAGRSMLDGVPTTMPALAYAQAVQDRAGRAGFQGPAAPKDDAVTAVMKALADEPDQHKKQDALGRVLFGLVGAARDSGVDAEQALRAANQGFYRRVVRLEGESREKAVPFGGLPLSQ